jgi:hypothetical protein
MKVELVQFYVKKESVCFYSGNFTYESKSLGLYLGEDNEHVWIQPLVYAKTSYDNTFRIYASMSRFLINDVVISEPEINIDKIPFGEMKYHGESIFDLK